MGKRDTRTAILEAAIAVMGREGYDGLSASRLAGAAGISKSNLFHHFRSMDEVPVAAFDLISDDILAVELPQGASLAALLSALGEAAFAAHATQRAFNAAYLSFIGRALVDPALRSRVGASIERAKKRLWAKLADRLGEDGDTLIALSFALIDGMLLHMLVLDNEADMRAAWARFVHLVELEEPDARRD